MYNIDFIISVPTVSDWWSNICFRTIWQSMKIEAFVSEWAFSSSFVEIFAVFGTEEKLTDHQNFFIMYNKTNQDRNWFKI